MADPITNFFVHRSAAMRYAAARPYFHPLVAARTVAFTKRSHFSSALDVACGTGQSARALADFADLVEAIDISEEMLAVAERNERIHYQLAPAERIPFDDYSFELITVGSAFHWFDQAAFLAEAQRVLKADGWLVVYNSGFEGAMVENEAFSDWAHGDYLKRFPSPPRWAFGVGDVLVASCGFDLVGSEEFDHPEVMTAERLTGYLTTQSNVIAAVEGGDIPLQQAVGWIADGVRTFFDGKARTMRFSGNICFFRKRN